MEKRIRARFSRGKIVLLEEVKIPEGAVITVTIDDGITESPKSALERTAGAWKDTLDFDAYLRDLYAGRRQPSPDVKL